MVDFVFATASLVICKQAVKGAHLIAAVLYVLGGLFSLRDAWTVLPAQELRQEDQQFLSSKVWNITEVLQESAKLSIRACRWQDSSFEIVIVRQPRTSLYACIPISKEMDR